PAEEAARRAVASLGPGESRSADEAQAVAARLSGQPQRAQQVLARLVARRPEDVEARLELADAHCAEGSLDRAPAAPEAAGRPGRPRPRAAVPVGARTRPPRATPAAPSTSTWCAP